MVTIGQLVKRSGLSRSALLYYDRIGLLKPSGRTPGNYRLYTDSDVQRLEQITLYRDAGLSLEQIAQILDESGNAPTQVLEQRLAHLNGEISRLRQQQQLIVRILGNETLNRSTRVMNKSQWVKILAASGMSEADMRQWHIEFERDLPEVHTDFLESLGIDAAEIKAIKAWSGSTPSQAG